MSTQTSSRDPVEKLAEEFAERYRLGERPSLTEYTQKYPELAEQIRDLFPALVVIEQFGSVAGPPTGPFGHADSGRGRVPEQLGEYRILREIGRGGMGLVYEAVQESLGRHVALKVLPFHHLISPTHLERFRREARAAAQLHHTNIVPVFGVGEHDGVHYYAMQFIQGHGLDAVLSELRRLRDRKETPAGGSGELTRDFTGSIAQGLLTGGFEVQQSEAGVADRPRSPGDDPVPALPEGALGRTTSAAAPVPATRSQRSDLAGLPEVEYFHSVARVGVQVAEALAYAHMQGIVHRDVKPSNLLLDTRGIVWITDFGLAKAEGSDELTSPGDIVGTVRYMAPERFEGRTDPRSDVYSLGATLYELLTLLPVFEDSNRARLMERVTHEEPSRPRRLDPHIPRDLETVVLKAIAKEPADRYQTADDLAEDLRRFLADRPINARRTVVLERAWRWCRRNPALASLSSSVGALLFVLVIGFGVATLLRKERNEALANLERAELAEEKWREEQKRATAIAHLAQARAYRWSGQVGQRFKSLNELAAAAKLGPSLELRNEALACLALTDLRRAKSWNGVPPGTSALAFDAQLEQYARSDQRGNLSVRRVADDRELALLLGPGRHAYYLRFSPDGRFLAAIYDQHVPGLYVWDWKRVQTILRSGLFGGVDFSPDSRRLVLGEKGSIRFFDLISGKEVKRIASKHGYHAFAFDPSGRRLAVVCHAAPRNIQIYDVDSGRVVTTLSHTEDLGEPSWSPDGHFLVVTSANRCLYVWDARTGKQQAVLRGHEAPPTDVTATFSHSGQLVASKGWDGTLRLWEPMMGRLLLSVPGGGGALWPRFSPDDRLLGCTTTGSEVELWELGTGAGYRVLHVPLMDGQIQSTAFSTDGLLVASATSRGVRLWDGTSGREVAHLPIGETRSVVFHPADGSLFTSGSRGVHRWPVAADPDSPHGLRIGPPQQLTAALDTWQIALSSDGHSLAVVD